LLNALIGVLRALARTRTADDRPDALSRIQNATARLAARLLERLVAATGAHPRSGWSSSRRRSGTARVRRALSTRIASGQVLPVAVALFVLLASVVSFGPFSGSAAAVAQGAGSARVAIGGFDGLGVGALAEDQTGGVSTSSLADDGTLWKPVSVDTTVQDGRSLLRYYTVQAGDTLTSIASRYGVSMMTIWWANKLSSKSLTPGTTLVIPPTTGLMVTVKAGDTLDSLAAKYKVNGADILSANGLTDPTLIVGQALLIPNATGAPIPTARKTTYARGTWTWPIQGARNYISQYFSYSHLAIDIACPYGSTIVSPLPGVVVFAQWRSGGGGYQVWINHGNGIYTTHLHMSKILVSVGQHVNQGQRIGLVGMTGTATGPHDHFGVSIGYPYRPGSYFVNPLRYY
jgi:murein DD-endopeptidase MepM/ murein hydrolase activator NlpD